MNTVHNLVEGLKILDRYMTDKTRFNTDNLTIYISPENWRQGLELSDEELNKLYQLGWYNTNFGWALDNDQ
jgi:hypothetical protein